MHASAILVEWNVDIFSIVSIYVITDFSYFQQYLKNQYLFSQVIKNVTSVSFIHQAYQNYKIQ